MSNIEQYDDFEIIIRSVKQFAPTIFTPESIISTLPKFKKKNIAFVFAVCLFFFLIPQLGIAQIITTIAGTGTSGYNGDGILATSAQLNGVQGIALDTAGNIYLGDIGGNRIRKITISSGLISTVAGTGTAGFNGDGVAATSAQIFNPSALTFDNNGNLYFTDRSNNRIRKISTSTGIISTVAGTGASGFNGDGIAATSASLSSPNEVSFDANGNVFIADWNNNRVRKVDKVTGVISTICGTGTAGFNGDGVLATAAQINGPCGIIFDNAGNIYIAEYGGARVRKITISTGIISTIAGTGVFGYNGDNILATNAQLNGCAYIKFDGSGNMYIGDAGNQRVRKLSAGTGIITTIAGNGTQGYNGDGIAATSAWLNYPFSVYFDLNNCKMYIADYYNNRVRKITGGFAGCTPAVAIGNLATCQTLPSVTIDNTNYNSWVPVYDSAGRIAAEIKANGNSLGVVNTSLYTKTGACREDVSHRLYLNRNITITPQIQPSSSVDLRIYIRKSELDSIKTALNSQGQPSGVASINEIEVFKNNDNCLTVGSLSASRQTSTNSVYGTDYYLQLSISSFSSFYFANKVLTAILPIKLFSFSGTHQPTSNHLQWKATCYGNAEFIIQRSSNSFDFINVGSVQGNASDINKYFEFSDNIEGEKKLYYRLKIIEWSRAEKYSQTIILGGNISNHLNIEVIPNLVNNGVATIQIQDAQLNRSRLILRDMQGKFIDQKDLLLQNGLNIISFDVSKISNGIYQFLLQTNSGKRAVCKFLKVN